MPLDAQIIEDELLIFGYGDGELQAEDFISGMQTVSALPGFQPGMDRLIVFEPTTSLACLDNESLNTIKTAVYDLEMESSGTASSVQFRTAIVCPVPVQAIIVSLYDAIWLTVASAQVEIRAFSSLQDALAWIGRPHLDIDRLIRRRAPTA